MKLSKTFVMILSTLLAFTTAQAGGLPELEESIFIDDLYHMFIITNLEKGTKRKLFVDSIRYKAGRKSKNMIKQYITFEGQWKPHRDYSYAVCLKVSPYEENPTIVMKWLDSNFVVENNEDGRAWKFFSWEGSITEQRAREFYETISCIPPT